MEAPDIDGDGIPNERDNDVDNDGQTNAQDDDDDGDGTPDATDEDPNGPTPETHHLLTLHYNLSGDGVYADVLNYGGGNPYVWERSAPGSGAIALLLKPRAIYFVFGSSDYDDSRVELRIDLNGDLNGAPWLPVRIAPDTDVPGDPKANDTEIEVNGEDQIEEIMLVNLGKAPEVLPVNSDFDEGRVWEVGLGYVYAIPDCDDVRGVDPKTGAGNTLIGLSAVRDHLDDPHIKANKLVTDDLHNGWFGVPPTVLDDDFWDGATVTIRKIDKVDEDTERKESGQIRCYAAWGDDNDEYYAIIPYDLETLAPNNLVNSGIKGRPNEGVYGSSSTIPENAGYWMEGVRPGKITLEWRFQKGAADFKYVQTFLVATQKSKQEWIDEVHYQLKLQTSIAPYPPELDYTKYDTDNGFWERGSGITGVNHHYVREIYYYYRQLFVEKPEEFYWAGFAKVAVAAVYGSMADMQFWKEAQETLEFRLFHALNGGTEVFLDDLLMTGNKEIFLDLGWGHHAYAASGIWALNYIEDSTAAADRVTITDFDAWEKIDAGIAENNINKMSEGALDLLKREQDFVMQRYYNVVTTLKLRPPPLAKFIGAVAVTKDKDGLVNAGEWLSANATRNPMPGGPALRDGHPTRRLDRFADRWAWINNPENGMWQRWMGTSSQGPNFDKDIRALKNLERLRDAAMRFSFTSGEMLPHEP